MTPRPEDQPIFAIERPDSSLMLYYFLTSLLLGPLFFVALAPRFFRYHTLRYRFDDEGLSMSWGILFRREIHLTYSRIQDLHLRSNVVERWLGLARVEVQTASGSAKAEMTIEGLPQYEQIRDFVYARMRGHREEETRRPASPATRSASAAAGDAELAALLRQIADELRATRDVLARSGFGSRDG
ncbi:MAG: PH domain-containing protein [Acidobacteriota bacterium]|nr:MAG: PH domain-containing protein [Acidobacteriota bacterium]